VALEGLTNTESYVLRVEVSEKGRIVRQFACRPFKEGDHLVPEDPHSDKKCWIAVIEKWMPEKLWDIHIPENQLTAQVTVVDAKGKTLDVGYAVPFGFREFWIEGKDFYLNGSRIFLSAVPLDNAQIGARTATYEAARETMRRLQSFGINFVYTH